MALKNRLKSRFFCKSKEDFPKLMFWKIKKKLEININDIDKNLKATHL